jgi:predicted 3-demethylubiquinone-9 3-methyltransferase (glyoxalase superfamily)
MSKITTCLWFNGNAEEAASFYVSLLPDSRILSVAPSPADNPSTPAGAVLTVDFTIAGQPMRGLNGGPEFQFNEAISLVIDCEDQTEVDRLWAALTAGGGSPGQCGWLKDRFGLSWQIVPRQLGEVLGDPDSARAGRAMEAMLRMTKIDIDALRRAADGVAVG